MNFHCQIETETKIADEIEVGTKLSLSMFDGKSPFTVTSIDGDTARLSNGGMFTFLKKRDDGWYDQHIRVDERVRNVKVKIFEEP